MRPDAESPNTLTAGEWRVDRGVQRWWPAPVTARTQTPLAHTVALLIACPFCRALVSETCRSRNGKRCEPHSVRLIYSRRCKCGARLQNRSRKPPLLCEECRAAARRETWRLNKQQQRSKRDVA